MFHYVVLAGSVFALNALVERRVKQGLRDSLERSERLPAQANEDHSQRISQFAPSIASHEFGAGSWINRHQLLKASYEWLKIENVPGAKFNVLGFQFVTTFHAYDRAFHQ